MRLLANLTLGILLVVGNANASIAPWSCVDAGQVGGQRCSGPAASGRPLNAGEARACGATNAPEDRQLSPVSIENGTADLSSRCAADKSTHDKLVERGATAPLSGNLTSEVDAKGNAVVHEYDAHNRRLKTKDDLGERWAATYDLAGNRVSETDGKGSTTQYAYDAANQVVSATRGGIRMFLHEYDEAGNLAYVTDGNGNKSGYEYNGRNLRTAENRPLAAISTVGYDAMGDPVLDTDPENRKTARVFDLRRRLIKITNGANETTTQNWDGAGNLVKVTRPLGNTSTRGFDAANRLMAVTTAAGTSRLGYDANGNLTNRTDANGNKTEFVFDARNRRTVVTYADGAKETTSYDGNGNPKTLTDGRGNVIDYTFDVRNRETQKRYTAGPDGLTAVTTSWDGSGNRVATRIDDGAGSRSHSMGYDAFDHLIQESDPWGKSVTHGYDAAGNRTSTTAQGTTSRYSVDALNRRVATLVPGGAVNVGFDRSGLPTETRYPDGTRSLVAYDEAGRIVAVDHDRNGTVFASSQYSYDANGNRTAETTTEGSLSRSASYAFDSDDRLVQEVRSDANGSRTVAYTLDAAGNRVAETHTGTGAYAASDTYRRSFTLNSRNQVTAIDQTGGGSAGHTTYQYDTDGHLTRAQGPAQDATYVWNVRGQLVQALSSGSPIAGYRYDANGLREEKVAGGQTRRTLWIDGLAALDQDEAGNAQGRYEVGPNGRTPLALVHPMGNEYLHADALGSITQATVTGTVVATTQYDAWGNALQSGSTRSKFGYTGHQPDGETGLIYFKARYYDPTLGRFIGEDPMEGEAAIPLSWRSYLYANGNPLYYVDKNGESATVLGAIGGFFWGFGQMIGAEGRDAWNGEIKSTSDYLGVWGQNIVAGAELGLSVDAAVLSGGTGIALSGAAGNAGLGALTVGGRGASAGEFAKQQVEDAAIGAVLGGVLSKAAPLIGKVGSAIAARTPGAVKAAVGIAAEKAAGIYERSGASSVVANVEKVLSEGLVKEGGKKELTADIVPGMQKSARPGPSQAEETATRMAQGRAEGQITADTAATAVREVEEGGAGALGGTGAAPTWSPILTAQKEISIATQRKAAAVDRWFASSDSRLAVTYRDTLEANPNFAAMIRGRVVDRRMNSWFKSHYGDVKGAKFDQVIPGSGTRARPDLYLPDLDGKSVIFDIGGASKVDQIHKYDGMADYLFPILH